ncbi:CehA/McbA family metallohydrolase [Paenibacillus sp. S150]|uniref:CehA/McbA family metallohydrolase n=1 Tax=Paenibacillus sp. S150 TaxID=2749826 RepID=UPI001C5A43FC|nr:CehA/McbA family metallohydrolase [Paenibacillus sp. S150]MBW4082495.1 PHP domain-containing protein [Paenibacillus sp. S150]
MQELNAVPKDSIRKLLLARRIEAHEQGGYLEMVFQVPEGTERIEVFCTVQPAGAGDSVIDLGVRDGERVRGWSGGARREFFIGLNRATPGYRAGSIPPGEWAVILGTHRVAPEGCAVQLDVRLHLAQPRWLCGDLHLHTEHSDGVFTLEETVRLARNAGLDYIALTDHNTSSQNSMPEWADGLLIVPGMELTTGRGHCNLYGVSDPLRDFRAVHADQLTERLAEARAAGAYISLNHPHDPDCGWHWGYDADHDWVEIWNGPWREANALTLSWWQEQLSAGRRLTAVSGSDTHRPHPYVRHGWPVAWVLAEGGSVRHILEAVNQGRVTLSYAPEGPFAELSCGDVPMGGEWRAALQGGPPLLRLCMKRLLAGDEVVLWSDKGREYSFIAEKDGGLNLEQEMPGRAFWRAEIWRPMISGDSRRLLAAATNPVYFE